MASSRSEDTRRRIVVTATGLFSRYGFRRTSVDLLAMEAGVAKPTVYAHFDDKDAVFRAVVESVCDELLATAKAAVGSPAAIEERLSALLSAKFTRYWELVHASPHVEELMDSQGRLGAEIVQRFDRAYLKVLVSALEGADELDLEKLELNASSAARLLLRAASGAAYDATSAASHRNHLTEIVGVIVVAMRKRHDGVGLRRAR